MTHLPITLAKKLLILQGGGSMPASQLRHAIIDEMLDQGILYRQVQGRSKQSIRLPDAAGFAHYLQNHYGVADLAAYVQHYATPSLRGADAIALGSDSKLRTARTFKGFLVNAFDPIHCKLHGTQFVVQPAVGTNIFIADYEDFIPNPDVTIIGIENPENFQAIRRMRHLFGHLKALFVSRYPQGKDLVRWLSRIPNPYLHFGDIDFAGLNIYWNEYKAALGGQAQFYLPDATEALMAAYGNRSLYKDQQLQIDRNQIDESALLEALALIERYGKGLEQEVFLGEG